MSNLDDQTLEILAGLNAAQPTTQQVDYSQFMNDFQPVQNYPNYFVPQQGLLQNTPVLDTLSDLDVMQQRPPVVMDMLNQYPTLESDFQRSFAVSPDTFNMNVYQPLPYDANYWQSFVNQGGGIGGDSGIDLGTAAGIITGGISLLGGDDDDDNDDNGDDGGDGNGSGGSGGSGGAGTATTIISSGTNNGTTVDNTELDIKDGTTVGGGNNTGSTTLLGGSNDDDIDGSTNDNTIIKDGTTVGGDGSTINGTGSNTVINTINSGSSDDSADGSTTLDTKDSGSNYITKNDANDIIQSLIDSNDISLVEASSLIDTINNTSTAFGTALVSGLNQIKNSSTAGTNLITKAQTGVSSSLGNTQFGVLDSAIGSSNAVNLSGSLIKLDGELSGLSPTGISSSGASSFGSYFDEATGEYFTQILDGNNNLVWTKEVGGVSVDADGNLTNTGVQIVDDPRSLFDRFSSGVTDFLGNTINEGLGTAGSALNDATSFTGGEALALGGGILSGLDAIEDGNIANVSSALGGIGASGLLGGTAYNTAVIPATTTAAAVPVGGAASGLQGLATNPATIALLTALTIAQQLAPDPSNKTGFGGFDLGTSTNESFGMEGDKFKQGNVDKATVISESIGTAINAIASDYGLKTEGDILAQTGNRDPLSITFGDQESEQTVDDRLNYSSETGDILNTTDDVSRFYYTGQVGNDGSALVDNIVKGTNLLSLKAVANDEDTINMKDFRLPAFSSDKVKNQYLDMGLDETSANALTNASRSGSAATSELLGGLLVANTTNKDLFLTEAEKTSLLEKGYTEEQLDEILYG